MASSTPKHPLVFYRSGSDREPVREWLQSLPVGDRRAVGLDLMRAQFRWPVGMPLVRPMGQGLYEIRSELPSRRIARVLLFLCRGELVALHGFIKKTQATPKADLDVARQRMKEYEQWTK